MALLTKEFLQDVFRESENASDISITEIEVTSASGKADNYSSVLHRVKVKGTRSRELYNVTVIVKLLPNNPMMVAAFRINLLFVNEATVYNTLLPAFQEFSRTKAGTKVFKAIPKCYHAIADGTNYAIVLEDLKTNGFVMANRKQGLDLAHCELAMNELGRFHALSQAMKQDDPEGFKRIRQNIKVAILQPDASPVFGPLLSSFTEQTVDCLKTSGADSDSVKKLEELKDVMFLKICELVKPKEPLAVVCHGDFWNNNIMFSYDKNSPSSAKFVDFQLSMYASPAIDILKFLYTATTKQLRDEHLHDILQAYHNSFTESMKILGSDPDVFTFQMLQEDLHEHSLFGFAMGLWMLPMMTAEAKDVPDLEGFSDYDLASAENQEMFKPMLSELFRARALELVQDFVDRGVL